MKISQEIYWSVSIHYQDKRNALSLKEEFIEVKAVVLHKDWKISLDEYVEDHSTGEMENRSKGQFVELNGRTII